METPIGKNIASAFVKAQRQFGPALKTSTNPHFRSKYADLSNCIEAVIDALNAVPPRERGHTRSRCTGLNIELSSKLESKSRSVFFEFFVWGFVR